MRLKQGDLFQATIRESTKDEVTAKVNRWSNISRIIVDPRVSRTVLTPGKQLLVEVDRIENSCAYVTQASAPYGRDHWPGDTVSASARGLLGANICEGHLRDPRNIDRLILIGCKPLDEVEATVVKLRSGTAFARVVETIESGIRPGDQISVTTRKKSTTGEMTSTGVEVTLDRIALCKTKAEAQVTSIEERVHADVIPNQGNLPTTGETVTARGKQGELFARAENGGYGIQLDHPSVASGMVDVQLTEIDPEDGARGTISSYRGNIPEPGQTVSARVSKKNKTATPKEGQYDIELRGEVPKPGRAAVKITELGTECFYGEVASYESRDDDGDRVVGSKNDILQNSRL